MHNDVAGASVTWKDVDNDRHFGMAPLLPAHTVKSFNHIARETNRKTCRCGLKTQSFGYQVTDVSELHPF